jgi:hypothetical protein
MHTASNNVVVRSIGAAAIFAAAYAWNGGQPMGAQAKDCERIPTEFVAQDGEPQIDNKYFTIEPGTKIVYESQTSEGLERIDVVMTHDTRKVMGVWTRVVRDTVWVLDTVSSSYKLLEDTRDWYAQDNCGNVWYFGEFVENYNYDANGNLIDIDNDGSWEAGKDILNILKRGAKAKPGIVMLANPQVGDEYKQEDYAGVAEDMGTVVRLGVTVKVPYGTFKDCLQTRDWSLIDETINDYKYYCPAVGFTTLEKTIKGRLETVELVSVSRPSKP